jgi:hypothetical protein
MREREIEAYFCKRVKEAGGLQRKFVSPGHRGVPDRIVVHLGDVYFVELKAPGEKLRPDQDRERKKFLAAGGEVFVFDTKSGIDLFITYLESAS